ncbi:hypothetical protein [Streptomyces sp. NPDC051546]|uniref:hypothetical protein n=1 Tax=Streptomyces sp. NPDC051546 TaxID=3365655 RepID=UPI00379CE676
MDLRFHVYAATEGATRNTYPGPTGSPPVLVPYTVEELRGNALRRDAVLAEWAEADPTGHELWVKATGELHQDQELTGWAGLKERTEGIRLADPCRYCRECRSRR